MNPSLLSDHDKSMIDNKAMVKDLQKNDVIKITFLGFQHWSGCFYKIIEIG